jgi:hypothetical protein
MRSSLSAKFQALKMPGLRVNRIANLQKTAYLGSVSVGETVREGSAAANRFQ